MLDSFMTYLTNALNLMKLYDGLILDIWGVIHDGVHAYPGTVDCVNSIITSPSPKTVFFLSNAPRPGSIVVEKLIELGVKVTPEMILTSGDLVRMQLQNFDDPIFSKLGKRFYHLGEARNQDILADLTLKIQKAKNLEEADFILTTGYLDKGEDLSQHDPILNKGVQLNLPMVCANPDIVVVHNHRERYCAGYIAERYEKMGGIVHYYGKPYPAIYELILKKFEQAGIQNKAKILAIGDTLETDIIGANNAGIDSALVLTGNMEKLLAHKNNSISQNEFLQTLFTSHNLTPTWVIKSLSFAVEEVEA